MSIHQHSKIEDTVYFWFGSNDTSGSGNDGAAALADVRLAGAGAAVVPVLSPVPTLLTHANYPAGCYEVAVAATVANGFVAGNTYGVFCTLTVDGQNPTGFVGSFTIGPIRANIIEVSDDSGAADNMELDYDGTGYAKANSTIGTATAVTNQVTADMTAISGDAGAADNLELDYDGTGYAKANSTIGTATAITNRVTANTDQIEGGDATDAIRDAVVDDATRIDASTLNTLSGHDPGSTIAAQSDVTGLNDLSAAQVNTEVDTALTDIDLDHLIQVSAGAEEPTDGSYLDQVMHKDAGQTFDPTTDSLEAIRDTAPLGTAMRGTDNAALAATALTDATWTDARAGYLDELAAANLPTDITTIDTVVDAIKAVTDNLPDSGALNDLAAILADTGTAGVVISVTTQQAIADETLKRGVSNVEDTADATSIAALVLAAFESVIAGATWTIYKTDHATTFTTRTVTTDAAADPIVEVT